MNLFKNNIDFNTYKMFYAVAVFGSFSKAAEELYISQPAVSYSIKKLEDELQTKLFLRLNKGIKLTEEGEKLKYYIESAFNNIVEGINTLNDKNDDAVGKISIGIHSNIGTFLLPKYIKEFLKLYPNIKIIIHSGRSSELKKMLRDGTLDIIILHYPIFTKDEQLEEEKLFSSESCFFGTKKYYDAYMWSKKEKLLIDFPLLLPIKGPLGSSAFEKIFKRNNMVLSSNVYLYTTEMLISLVKEEIGIGCVLRDCIKKELANNELYELPIDYEMPKIDFGIAYDKKHINTSAQNFANYLIEKIKKDYLSQDK